MQLKKWEITETCVPPLASYERESLKNSIQEHGQQIPIKVLPDGRIIDGHHRYAILGDTVKYEVVDIDEATAIVLAQSLNMDRRQLSGEQIREIRERQKSQAIKLRGQGKTQAEAAKAVGVAQNTLSGWEKEQQGNITNATGCNTDNNTTEETDTTNIADDNSCIDKKLSSNDCRVKISKSEYPKIYAMYKGGMTQQQIADEVKATQQAIAKIICIEKNREEKEESKKKAKQAEESKIKDQEIIVKPGQVWKLGKHFLYCADIDSIDISTLGVTAVITDPPYGIQYKPDWKKWDGSESDFKEIKNDDKIIDCSRYLEYETVLLFGAENYLPNISGGWLVWDKRLDEKKDNMIGSPFEMAWYKSRSTDRKKIMIRVLHGGVINDDSKNGNNEKRIHTTQKPVRLFTEILERITEKNDVILDPFSGGGTTLIAAEITGRKCIAVEIEPEYCKFIIDRYVSTYKTEAILWQE